MDKIKTLVNHINNADAIVLGAGSGMSNAAGMDFWYEASPLFMKYMKDFYDKYHFKGLFNGFYNHFKSEEEHFKGAHQEDLNQTITRTIKVQEPSGKLKIEKQVAQIYRDATVDDVTGEVSYHPWISDSWKEYDALTIPGYTPSPAQVESHTVVPDYDHDTTIDIVYTANDKPFNKVTITEVCNLTDITRPTFYIHYNSINDLLNAVLDDALFLEDPNAFSDLSPAGESFLTTCQRIGSNRKYRKLLMEPDLSEYIINRIVQREGPKMIPGIMRQAGVAKRDAEILFSYAIHGSFAVSKAHQLEKDGQWFHDVQLLNHFTEAGYHFLKNN